MPKYSVTGQENAVTASLTTAACIIRGASRRAKIYDFSISQGAAPADTVIRWTLMRFTAAPTVTAVVPATLDSADPASITTAGENATAEGTYTAATELWDQSINQRALYRWVASPGSELVVPDTAANGIGVRVLAASYTGAADVSLMFEE